MMTRRNLLALCGGAAAFAQKKPLDITEFEPRSMLQVTESRVRRARFPVIDIHTHLSWPAKADKGVPLVGERRFPATPDELLAVMDAKNLRTMVNLTGGYGDGLKEAVKRYDR